jgi:hypothetical protein
LPDKSVSAAFYVSGASNLLDNGYRLHQIPHQTHNALNF